MKCFRVNTTASSGNEPAFFIVFAETIVEAAGLAVAHEDAQSREGSWEWSVVEEIPIACGVAAVGYSCC